LRKDENCRGVELLLVNKSTEKVPVLYNENSKPFLLPKIGPRPPYYCYPCCESYYPII
jgi:hypothetical protein